MKRGFIGTIIFLLILAILGAIGFFIYQNYSSAPNANTKKTAQSIYKYPNATTWQEEDSKNVCFLDPKCSQPVKIYFETPNDWGTLYSYYIPTMAQFGWKTNSNVVTSIPTSVVFTKGTDGCKATLENYSDIKYSFTVVCPNPT